MLEENSFTSTVLADTGINSEAFACLQQFCSLPTVLQFPVDAHLMPQNTIAKEKASLFYSSIS